MYVNGHGISDANFFSKHIINSMSEWEKPFVDASQAIPADDGSTHAAAQITSHSGGSSGITSARRAAVASSSQIASSNDAFGAGVLDASATENRPYSVVNRPDTCLPGRRIW